MTTGVNTTASAKLNRSATCRATPASIPVEMVAPERENPRNGRHKPCTTPMTAAWPACNSPPAIVGVVRSTVAVRSLRPLPARRIRSPTAASAPAISHRLPKMSSICASGCPRRATFSMSFCRPRPTMPVATVAMTTCLQVSTNAPGRREIIAPPLLPEIEDHREHRARVQHHEQEGHLRLGGVEAEQLFGHDDVRRTGHRQQFAESLDDGEQEDVEIVHARLSSGRQSGPSVSAAFRQAPSRRRFRSRPRRVPRCGCG